MASKGRESWGKRQREQTKREKQEAKRAERAERKVLETKLMTQEPQRKSCTVNSLS